MSEQPPANEAVAKTILALNALVERLYDTQAKFGVWQGEREDSEDYGSYVAAMHAKLSTAYQGLVDRSNPPFDLEYPFETAKEALLEVVADALGLLRRNGVDVGKDFLDMVMDQASEAAALVEAEAELKTDKEVGAETP